MSRDFITHGLNEAKGAGLSAFFDASVAEAIQDFPSSTELTLGGFKVAYISFNFFTAGKKTSNSNHQ